MKNSTLFAVYFTAFFLFGLQLVGWAQVTLPHYEPFDFTAGKAMQAQAGWIGVNTGDSIYSSTGNLSYAGLQTSIGNKITYAGLGMDASKVFTLQATDTVVYYSFIMKVTSLGALNAVGGYFTGFGQNATTFGATVWTGLDGTGYKIGINPRTSTTVNMNWVAGTNALNDSVFVVICYELKAGTGNDIVKIWVNPGVSTLGIATAPAADATVTNITGTDLTSIVQFFIRQDSDTETPTIVMDECRVGSTWADVTPAAAITASDLFFSEYIEGASNNKALEIFNGTGADVDLSGYVVKQGNNGGAWGADSSSASLPLSGILASGDVYIIANAQAISGILAQADTTFLYNATLQGHTVPAFNGDDALGLFKGGVLIDVIGVQGIDPGTGWPVAGIANATVDRTLVRKTSVTQGTTDWVASSGTNVDDSQWIVNAKDFIDNLGTHTFGVPADVTAPTFTATPNNGDINVAVNTPIVLTFNEAIRNIDNSEITNANVADLLTLKETDASGAVVSFTATIDAAKKVITAIPTANLKNSQVYYAAITPVEDASNNATIASSMTFTTIAASAATISGVAITETAPYFAGDTITITWVSSNVTDVLIEAWVPSDSAWVELFASTPSDGTEMFTLPNDAQYSTDYKIRVSNLADTTVNAESSIFTIIAVASDLLTLRAQPINAIVKYTGIATVTYARTARNQKYIQDTTAAVLIDDPTGYITGAYTIGDGITNVVGKILFFNTTLMEFTPQSATGEPAIGTTIIPEVRTLESIKPADQCKLVKIENFAFKTPTQYDTTGKFVYGKTFDIEGIDKAIMAYRTAFTESDYIGGYVPVGPISSIVLVGQFYEVMQITARSWSDMTIPTIADFDGTPTSILEDDTVQFMDMSTNNPTSWEWTFEGGHPATSTDKNPLISYAAKGTYTVTLKATNASGGNNTITKTDYINVGAVGISILQSSVSMYPNPTTGRLFITNPAKDKQEIAVFNAVGIQVNSFASADGIISLDIATHAKGMYLVRITNKVTKSVQFKKIVLY